MSFGKNATKAHGRSPPPLPMYERVVLKHVPTMVRRRYDRDLNIFDSTQASESEGAHEAEDANPDAFSDEDDCLDNEAEDEMHAKPDTGHDRQTCTNDFGSNNSGPSVSVNEEDSNNELGGSKEANLTSFSDTILFEDRLEDDVHENSDNDQGLCLEDIKDEDDGAIDANNLENYEDDSVKNEVQDNEHGLHVEDFKSEAQDVDVATYSVDDSFQDEEHGSSGNKQGLQSEDSKNEGKEVEDENFSSYGDDSVNMEIHDNELENFNNAQGMHEEDSTREIGGAEEPNLASVVDDRFEDEIEDDVHEIDNDQGLCSEDCKDDDDGAIDANNLENHADAIVDEVQDNENGLHVEDSKNEGRETKDANVISYYVDDSVEGEVHDKEHGNSFDEDEQGLHVEECKKREGDGAKDGNIADYYVGNNVKDEVQKKGDGNFDNKQGLYLEDSKSEGEGVEDENLAGYGDASVKPEVRDRELENPDNKQDFTPEAFKQTLEQDGYDLCCPNCKNYITETMIFRRKEDCPHYRTTCFTCFISLFRCIRW